MAYGKVCQAALMPYFQGHKAEDQIIINSRVIYEFKRKLKQPSLYTNFIPPKMATHGGNTGDLPSEILHALSQSEPINSSEAFPSQPSTVVKSALDTLLSRSMVTYKANNQEDVILETEGEQILANGSHEVRILQALQKVRGEQPLPKMVTPLIAIVATRWPHNKRTRGGDW